MTTDYAHIDRARFLRRAAFRLRFDLWPWLIALILAFFLTVVLQNMDSFAEKCAKLISI